VPLVFGSRSTYLRASFGGLDGRALRAGDELRCGEASTLSRRISDTLAHHGDGDVHVATWSVAADIRPAYASEVVVRFVDGAHTHQLTPDSRDALSASRFRISSSSDRMGYRLEGATIALQHPVEMLSEAVAFGTVQLPPGGAPIVLMADRQTTGGYPRIGEVASVDLPLVAQLKPGDTLRFVSISLEEAERLYLAREQDLAQARVGIALRSAQGKS
jgi:antagonist of KipI